MARKPNYKFDCIERERAKASKKALRAKAKAEKADARKAEQTALAPPSHDEYPAGGFPEKPDA